MTRKNIAATGLIGFAAGALILTGCQTSAGDASDDASPGSASTAGGTSSAIITANGTEPENPLIPTNTSEVGGGRIIDSLFAGLVSYAADGESENEVAEDITVDSPTKLTVKLKEGLTFTNGEEVTADNFIKAWNYGATASNDQKASYFFKDIVGYDAENDSELTGLEQVDDYTFTITLQNAASDFAQRLGYSAYYPLPDVAFEDMEAFGENPVGNGPYMLAGEGAWQHDVQIDLVANPDYEGPRTAQNGGLTIVFYASFDSAYSDLLADNLDILDTLPDSALASYESDLDGRAVNQPSALFQSFTIPARLEHWSGEEGDLRRKAISMAFDREEITDVIFQGTRTPASDFSSPVVDGWTDSVPGNEVLEFNPDEAKKLWEQADAISPWSGAFQIAYNADGGHAAWADAVTNQIAGTLGIEASGNPYPTFRELRSDVSDEKTTTPSRSGWQADYPGLYNYLGPLYGTGASSNDGKYSSETFDRLIAEGLSETDPNAANAKFIDAQAVLFEDLPAIPLWYNNAVGGWSSVVENVRFGWDSVPRYFEVTKAE